MKKNKEIKFEDVFNEEKRASIQSLIEEYKKFTNIAHSKIPVSEEHIIFHLFKQRRESAEILSRGIVTENDRKLVLDKFRYYEDQIKKYLFL